MQSLTKVFMSTALFRAGGRLRMPIPGQRNVFLYVVRGAVLAGVAEDRVSAFHLAEMAMEGDELDVVAPEGAVVLLGHAEPIGAPVVSHGPFVMNSRAEIEEAIRDYQAGRFGAPM